jgi:NAD(P)-dependent dehydrogenase (short-subunit alcohol dehydrogenase family)
MDQFHKQVAVITGGASGIGLAMAERFAREGMRIVIADIEQEALDRAVAKLRASGAEAIGVRTDVADIDSVRALAQATLDAYGGVHVLCNNAGVQVAAPTWQIPLSDWKWALGVNLWGVIHGVHVFVPIMLKQNEPAHIVNTASMAGLISASMMACYSVTKHSVVTLSETLAMEMKQFGFPIGVSVLCPGFVQTRMHESDRNRPPTDEPDQVAPDMRAMINQGVASLVTNGKQPSEVAELVLNGIRDNRLHLLSHPEMIGLFERRVERIIAAARPT